MKFTDEQRKKIAPRVKKGTPMWKIADPIGNGCRWDFDFCPQVGVKDLAVESLPSRLSDKEDSAVCHVSKVKMLSSLEHIRLRPGMYIGRMGDGSHPNDGIYVLLKETIDNCVDEFIMGEGRRIDIEIDEVSGDVTVRDYGRGIPHGKLVECVSQINTGAKYNTDVFQFSVGLNGVGTKAANALSETFLVSSFREGKFKRVEFAQGKLVREEEGKTAEKNGTLVKFRPDSAMFPKFRFDLEYVEKRLWMYAYLNSGLTLTLNGTRRFFSRHGLRDLIEAEVCEERLYDVVHHQDKTIEFAFCHTGNYGEAYCSFVNGQYTNDGGTHLSAFREGILKAINKFTGKSYKGNDVRDGIIGAVAVKLQDPVFESQTKNKLGNTGIRGWIVNTVRQAVVDYLHRHPPMAGILIDKVELNEKVRKEIQAVKRQPKGKSKKAALKVPNLRD